MAYRVNAAGMGSMRQLSPDIWNDCDVIDKAGPTPGLGSYYFNDFMNPVDVATTKDFTITTVTAGALTFTDARDGVLLFDSAGNNEPDDGVNVQFTGDNLGETWLPEVNEKLWFEVLAKVNVINNQFFIGLCDTETAIMISGALDYDSRSMIGFYIDVDTTAGYVEFVSANSGSATADSDVFNCASGGAVVVLDEWFKVGFVVEEVSGAFVIKTYCKPSASASRKDVRGNWMTTAASVPITAASDEMCISAVSQCEQVDSDAEMSWDWVCVAQGH